MKSLLNIECAKMTSPNPVPTSETPVDEVTAEYRMREDDLPHVRSRVNVGSSESAASEFISANPVPFSETPSG